MASETRLGVSVVIYQPDEAHIFPMLRSLCEAIERALPGGHLASASLHLVDNSPYPMEPEAIAAVSAAIPRHLPIEFGYDYVGSNLGYGSANNRAFALVAQKCDLFLVLNPDVEFERDSLAAGIDFLAAHSEIGLLAPSLLEDGGDIHPACREYPTVWALFLRGFAPAWLRGMFAGYLRRYEMRDLGIDRPYFAPATTSGCCMLMTKDCFSRLKGFDKGYFLYFEDTDLSYRAGQMGCSAYCPSMRIRHHGGGAASKGFRHIVWFVRSAWRFFNSHGWRWK